jgi:hypothetical protein
MAVDSLYKQRRGAGGRPFQKGQSGNLAGRPPGSRNRTTFVAEALLEGEAQALTRTAIELALEGDRTALRLCLEPPGARLVICSWQVDDERIRPTPG